MGILKDIAKNINDWRDKNRIKHMKRSDVEDIISDNIKLHKDIAAAIGNFTDQEMRTWMTNKVRPALDTSNDKYHTCLDEFYKHLGNVASAAERKVPLSSIRKANSDFAKILVDIKGKLDDFIHKEAIDIYESRISTLAILGILRESNLVANFSMYLFTYLCRIYKNSVDSIPRYRNEYMLENAEKAAKIVTKILAHRGPYNFLDDVSRLRKQNADLVLGFGGKIDFDQRATMGFYTDDLLDSIATLLSHLNIFDAVGKAWINYKVNKNKKNKEAREWLINHVNVLRMDLADKDPSSPEYTKMLNIIKAYDAKIAEYDKEIDEFENGD